MKTAKIQDFPYFLVLPSARGIRRRVWPGHGQTAGPSARRDLANGLWNGLLIRRVRAREHEMPIYAYKCSACGHAKDVLQKISDAPLTVCPECGQSAFSKQVTAAGFQLKGSGWCHGLPRQRQRRRRVHVGPVRERRSRGRAGHARGAGGPGHSAATGSAAS